jgi:hypothetical protein
MSIVFDVPADFDTLRAAVARVLKGWLLSNVYRYDEAIPGWCAWDILDARTMAKLGTISLRRLGDIMTRLTIPANRDLANVVVPALQAMGVGFAPRRQLVPLKGAEPSARTRPYGPTEKTRELAETIRRLKEQHPTWSQARVATELCLPVETIRNAYRAMAWTWPRADRVRRNR